MAILNNNPLVGASGNQGGYNINNSLRFRSSASARLSRTFSSTGTNNKIQTFSAWVKRGLLSSSAGYRLMGGYNGSANYSTEINFINDNLRVEFGGSVQYELKTTQVFRDPSAWYHIVVAIDTTQATSSNRVKMYVNGSQITAFATANYPAQNDSSQLTSANANNNIGASWSAAEPFDGYMAEVNFIDGSAKTPSDFGETDTTTGVWKPKAYSGTYGTNGFYLKFSDIATTSGSNAGLGKDFSGNSNYWTTNNISVTAGTTYDAMTDSPTNTSATVANYAVLNPLDKSTNVTITEGNLRTTSSTSAWNATRGSFAVSSGKWYFEVTVLANTFASNGINVGVMRDTSVLTGASIGAFAGATTWGLGNNNGSGSGLKANNGTSSAYGATWTTNDVVGIAFDVDAGSIELYKNGVSQGVAYSSQSFGTVFPFVAVWSSDAAAANFGQRPFAYTPPTGFVALNTYNLPTPTIGATASSQANKYMNVVTYSGTSATNAISVGFNPDLVWIKQISGANNHNLFDSVRGANKRISSNLTDAEVTYSDTLMSFDTNGFTLGADAGGRVNVSGQTFVGWAWDANGTGVTNTDGSITSTVSANTTSGFSIVTYTGTGANATVGHGLGVAPKMIILKPRSAVDNWMSYHSELGNTKYILLNSANAAAVGSGAWNNTSPTSSVFTIGTSGNVNTNGVTMVGYCWAEIAGFSRFGSYTGNGSTDGPFIYTGFRPKYVMIKRTNVANSWVVIDGARNTYNVSNTSVYPDLTSAGNTDVFGVDFLSNGFKLRYTPTEVNGSGSNYIYATFAENPFKNSLAR